MEPSSASNPEPAPAASSDLRTRYNPPARGWLDRLVRRFGVTAHVVAVMALYAIASLVIGLALAPALAFVNAWMGWFAEVAGAGAWVLRGIGFGLAFFIAGFALLCVVPVFNLVLPTRARPYHGGYFSIASVPWCLHNGLFYLARYTFLPFVTLTPFGPWFLRAMGMRIGKRAFINTEFISDPRLVEIGDDVVLGGSVHLFAHYGGGGHLTVAPVVIGDRATIGQQATIMGDVVVGADATVLPHSVVLPGSRIGDGETWGGVPAQRIDEATWERLRAPMHRGAGP